MGISKTYIPRLDLRLPAILFGLDSTAAFDSGVSKCFEPGCTSSTLPSSPSFEAIWKKTHLSVNIVILNLKSKSILYVYIK